MSSITTIVTSQAAPPPSTELNARPIPARAARTTRLLAGIALAGCLLTSACNTIEGAGKDVQSVGESTSQAARDVRDH